MALFDTIHISLKQRRWLSIHGKGRNSLSLNGVQNSLNLGSEKEKMLHIERADMRPFSAASSNSGEIELICM